MPKESPLLTRIPWLKHIVSRENLWAFLLFLILITVLIMTADVTPLWIYQGF